MPAEPGSAVNDAMADGNRRTVNVLTDGFRHGGERAGLRLQDIFPVQQQCIRSRANLQPAVAASNAVPEVKKKVSKKDPPPPKPLVPVKYTTRNDTPLKETVSVKGPNKFEFKLTD